MKKFNWINVLYASIGLCFISALFFFCGFFTANEPSLMEYHRTVLNAFALFGCIGSILFYIWALPHVFGRIGDVVKYWRWRYC